MCSIAHFCAVLIENCLVLNMKVCSMENLNFSVSTSYYKTVSQQCRTMDWARKAPNKERGRDYDLIISTVCIKKKATL